jgi:hypothetical protein
MRLDLYRPDRRVARLRREEQDLRTRLADRAEAAKREGRWLESDPLHQRLSAVLARVRSELVDAGQEMLPRASAQHQARLSGRAPTL